MNAPNEMYAEIECRALVAEALMGACAHAVAVVGFMGMSPGLFARYRAYADAEFGPAGTPRTYGELHEAVRPLALLAKELAR